MTTLKTSYTYTLATLLLLLTVGCTKEKDIITQNNETITITHPEYIPIPTSKTTLNLLKVSLGKKLFFDKNLSSNNKVSCGSCHAPKLAFSDNTPLSPKGVSMTLLDRNSPPLFNLAWHHNFFWDGGSPNLRSQVLAPLKAHNEMNASIDKIIIYLNDDKSYKESFQAAYNDIPKTAYLIDAIAEFEFSITSFKSKYDDAKTGKTRFTEIENKGFILYKQKCSSCHTEGLFSDYAYHNNGLDTTITNFKSIEDVRRGRNRITLDKADLQKFKTPSLRNLSLTAPYMHDGRFEKLSEVVDFYSSTIKHSSTRSEHLPVDGFNFSTTEKEALIAFLNTLNDFKSFQE